MKKVTFLTAPVLFLSMSARAGTAPYVRPESLWPFHTFEGLMVLLGFFAAYRAIRSHLPAGDDIGKTRKEKDDYELHSANERTEQTKSNQRKANDNILSALRAAGLIFMVVGSSLGFIPAALIMVPHIWMNRRQESSAARCFWSDCRIS
jgi:hypothetical protein